jgi:hypothetical protein
MYFVIVGLTMFLLPVASVLTEHAIMPYDLSPFLVLAISVAGSRMLHE